MDYGKIKIICFAFVLSLAVGFAGCTKTEVVTETSEINPAAEENDTSIEASLPTEEPELTKEPVQKEDITMFQPGKSSCGRFNDMEWITGEQADVGSLPPILL